MAYAKITTYYADDSAVTVEVGHDDAHPDLLDELVARCRNLWQQTIGEPEDTEA